MTKVGDVRANKIIDEIYNLGFTKADRIALSLNDT